MITQLLPDELLIKILAWTPITSHGYLRLSCKKLRSIVNSDEFRDTRIQGGFQENVIVAYVEGEPIGGGERVSQIWALLDGRWRQPPWSLGTFGVDFSRLWDISVVTRFKSDAGFWDSILLAGNGNDISSCTMRVLDGAVERLPPHRVRRRHPTVCHVGNRTYVIGGHNGTLDRMDASIEMYDPEVGAWTSLVSPMPHATSHAFAGVIRDKIYVAGWVSNEGFSMLQIYDIPSKCWEVGPPIPKALSSISGAIVNEKLYVVGRARLERRNNYTCYSLNVEDHMWTEIPMCIAETRHYCEYYAAIKHNGRLLVICNNKIISRDVDRDTIDSSPAYQLEDNGEWSKISLTTIPDLTKVTGLYNHLKSGIVSVVLC